MDGWRCRFDVLVVLASNTHTPTSTRPAHEVTIDGWVARAIRRPTSMVLSFCPVSVQYQQYLPLHFPCLHLSSLRFSFFHVHVVTSHLLCLLALDNTTRAINIILYQYLVLRRVVHDTTCTTPVHIHPIRVAAVFHLLTSQKQHQRIRVRASRAHYQESTTSRTWYVLLLCWPSESSWLPLLLLLLLLFLHEIPANNLVRGLATKNYQVSFNSGRIPQATIKDGKE